MKLTKNFYENKAWQNNKLVCGLDEVGRGCLAGPVVTAACVLPVNTNYNNLKDSKIMTKQEREEAFVWINKNCFYSIAIFDHKKIDKFNIYQATKLAMQKALLQLIYQNKFNILDLEFVLSDAMPLSPFALSAVACHVVEGLKNGLEFYHFPKGETYSTSIAAASIVAKVFRDNLMDKINNIFPEFNFKAHKGYGTSEHLNIINSNGISIIHRKSFLGKIQAKNNLIKNHEKQICLF
ncbi:MAG: ribonuclease HII [candidate division TM6 bacterium GW2011_GWF2_28_16]|nr:MAG: ribonuclease HII [candidate division TM6 bacterium GW2011_GWF2_28_16]